jgi:hypothetical protein
VPAPSEAAHRRAGACLSHKLLSRGPSCRVWLKEDDAPWAIRVEDYAALVVAWKAGATFFDALDIYGDPLTIKLAAVVIIGLSTPEGIARYDEDMAARKFEDDA